jgi:hypothetical protein
MAIAKNPKGAAEQLAEIDHLLAAFDIAAKLQAERSPDERWPPERDALFRVMHEDIRTTRALIARAADGPLSDAEHEIANEAFARLLQTFAAVLHRGMDASTTPS